MNSSTLLDKITFFSKNLYNVATYTVRQRFFEDYHWIRYQELRGLYVCFKCGSVLNADVNASQNILKKGVPKSVWIGNRGCLNHPVVLSINS